MRHILPALEADEVIGNLRGLEVHVRESEERLIQAARGDKIDGLEAASVLKRSKKEKRLEDWEEKVLHDQ